MSIAARLNGVDENKGIYAINKVQKFLPFIQAYASYYDLTDYEQQILAGRLRTIKKIQQEADAMKKRSKGKQAEETVVTNSRPGGLLKKMMPKHTQFLSGYFGLNPFASGADAVGAFRRAFPKLDVVDNTITAHGRNHCSLIIRRLRNATKVNGMKYSNTAPKLDSPVMFTRCSFYMYNRLSFGWHGKTSKSPEKLLPETGGVYFTLLIAFSKDDVLATTVETAVEDCGNIKFAFLLEVLYMLRKQSDSGRLSFLLDEDSCLEKNEKRILEAGNCSVSYIVRLDPCLVDFWTLFVGRFLGIRQVSRRLLLELFVSPRWT